MTSTARPQGSLLARLLLVACVGVGLVGMHHLVATTCHHVGSMSPAATSIEGHADHHAGSLPSAPLAPVDPPSSPADGHGAVGAAAMCLAILLMVVGLLLPAQRAWLRRSFSRERWAHGLAFVSRGVEPPDLARLSISRT